MLVHDFSKETAFKFESDKCYYQPNPFIGECVLYMKAANKDIITESTMIIDANVLTLCFNECDRFVWKTKDILRNAGIQATDTSKPQSAEMKAFRARYNVLKYYVDKL